MRSGRLVGALGAVALLASACTSGGAQANDDPTTASPTVEATGAPTPSATASSPSDPFAMPDPVTEEYVDRVVNTIYEEWGAITREILEQPADPTAITPVETRERIAALFGGQYLQRRLEEADEALRGDRGGLLQPDAFSQLRFSTVALKATSGSCLAAVGRLSFEGTAEQGGDEIVALSLSPMPVSEANQTINQTGWQIIDLLSNTGPDGNRLPDDLMLDAELEDFGDSLDHSC